MAVPNIVAFRINEKLIHGQGQPWVKALGVNTVIAANNSASEDTIQQTLMKVTVPKITAMRLFFIQHTCNVIVKVFPRQAIFVVCKTSEGALKLATGDVPVKEINVGDIYHTPGKEEVSKYIALDDEDKATLRQLRDTYGAVFNIRTTTSGDGGAARMGSDKHP